MQNQSTNVNENTNLHVINASKPNYELPAVVTGYGLGGKEVDPESKECLAKQAFDTGTGGRKYWLKRATVHSMEAGLLYNPHSAYFDKNAPYSFAPSNPEAFNFYLKFLNTGNTIFISHAERASI